MKERILILWLILTVPALSHELTGVLDGDQAGEQFGSAIATIDFNNDGYIDLAVSAPASDEGGVSSGKVYILFGGTAADLVPDMEIVGPSGSFFGKAVSSAGDFNHDGYEDLAVGAPYYDSPAPNCGAVFLYYGGETPDNIADHVFTGSAASDYFGIAVGGVEDFNGDSFNDLAIGSYKADWGGFSESGKVFVYFGGPAPEFTADLTLVGNGEGERFGYALTSNDFNNDGIHDIAVGAYSYDDTYLNQGCIYVFHGGGSPDSVFDLSIKGDDAGNKFGWALSAGDINNDGIFDIVMGTDGFKVDIYQTGKVYVFNGGPAMDNVADEEFSLYSNSDDFLGFAVCSGLDPNGDGHDEIMAGMPGNDEYDIDAGGAVLLTGGENLADDTAFLGGSGGEEMGKSVCFWENYDGSADLMIIGTSSFDNYRGRIYLYGYQSSGAPDCGDANADGSLNILDVTYIITFLYMQGPAPEPIYIADVNSSGEINLLDITYLIAFLYTGGPEPVCPETY